MSNADFDKAEFRKTLGQFATGVTIVTTLDKAGEAVGVTASSFNSLSMKPPMILWSLDKSAYSLPAFEHTKHFNVHVLGSGQDALSNCFAKPGTDKFDGIKTSKGLGGVPILPEYSALFECKTAHHYAGGDHIIIVGEVLKFSRNNTTPLVFHGGQYAGIGNLF
ncbi:MAG: flavin reductase family protein [Robiginitomaculum sp.]|nr:flavin reductase family protein [Robiginitomaculum sp.]